MDTVSVVAFCHGFKLSLPQDHVFREIGVCTSDGKHHTLLDITTGEQFETLLQRKEKIDTQIGTVHGLAFVSQYKTFDDQESVPHHVLQWYMLLMSSTRPAVGLFAVNPLRKLFQDLHIPTVNLQEYGLLEVKKDLLELAMSCLQVNMVRTGVQIIRMEKEAAISGMIAVLKWWRVE